MTIPIVSTTSGAQGWANRVGKLGAILDELDTLRATTYPDLVEGVLELFDGCTPDERKVVSTLNPSGLSSLRSGASPTIVRTLTQAITVAMADADTPLVAATLENALPVLMRQLTASYNAATNSVSATVTQSGLTGTGNVVASVKDVYGRALQALLADTLAIRVSSVGTAGAEVLRVQGSEAVSDKLSYLWPAGSGAVNTFTSMALAAAGNLVSNGGFEDIGGLGPTDWVIDTGTISYSTGSPTYYAGTTSIRMIGDGSSLPAISQTLTGLSALTQYAVDFVCCMTSTPAAGVLTVDLYDGASVINDDEGNPNSFTVSLTGISTTFVHKSGAFRMPSVVPGTVKLRLRITTAISNTHHLSVDNVIMQRMRPLTTDGTTPYVAVFGGNVNWVIADGDPDISTFKIVTTNDWASKWRKFLERTLDLAAGGYSLPTSGGTTLSESLLT